MKDNIIFFNQVTKKYMNAVAIQDITFEIKRGTINTLIGPNGVGKSTIARLILNIERPTYGEVINKANRIAYIPQKIVLNNSMPLDVKTFLNLIKTRDTLVDKDIEEFINLDKFYHKMLTDLSGGELQKIMIFSAIISIPELIVLDEPTSALDIDARNKFYQILDIVRNKYNTTIFMISHDLHTVMNKSDSVICLNKSICCKGQPKWISTQSSDYVANYFHNHS